MDILTRLRVETRAEHDAIESALALTHDALCRERYRRVLERFYGFYAPLEAGLWSAHDWMKLGIDPAERAKSILLERDLSILDAARPYALAPGPALPVYASHAQAFGCLYVLEGATLGGQLIGRVVHRSLGLTADSGARFFHGYGARTGAMWHSFRAALAAFAETSQNHQNEAVAAAIETFRRLRLWCGDESPR